MGICTRATHIAEGAHPQQGASARRSRASDWLVLARITRPRQMTCNPFTTKRMVECSLRVVTVAVNGGGCLSRGATVGLLVLFLSRCLLYGRRCRCTGVPYGGCCPLLPRDILPTRSIANRLPFAKELGFTKSDIRVLASIEPLAACGRILDSFAVPFFFLPQLS